MKTFLISIVGAIQGAYNAAASTFLASFPTPTLAAALAMASNKITGLAQATAAGDALRYEACGSGTLPTTAMFPTAVTATNCTEVAWTAGDSGVALSLSSATASPRLSGRLGAGSRIAAQIYRQVMTSSVTVVAGGGGVFISRADGKFVSFSRNLANYSVFYFTDKDTYSTTRATIAAALPRGGPEWIRLGNDGAGNVLAEVSLDNVTWQTVYTATIAAAFGDAGAITLCGPCLFTQNATLTAGVAVDRVTITGVL